MSKFINVLLLTVGLIAGVALCFPTENGYGSGVESRFSGFEASGIEVSGSGTYEDASYRMKRDVGEESSTSEATTVADEEDQTTVPAVESEGSGVTALKKCETLAVCQDHSDCNGGQCLGAFLGTCNCNACINFWGCSADSECGGLKNACNHATGMCDCLGAHSKNGFKDAFDAFTNLCNVKQCGKSNATDACFGLPCQTGRCFCL